MGFIKETWTNQEEDIVVFRVRICRKCHPDFIESSVIKSRRDAILYKQKMKRLGKTGETLNNVRG
jgi:hypothetical protein